MELNKELGKWLLDISKYLITAMLLTTAFGDMSNPWIVVSVIFSAALTFWLGYLLLKKSTQSINNWVKYKNNRYRKFNKNKKYDDYCCVHIRMRFGNYGLYFRYIPGQKKLRKQFLNKSKERRVPDDTLRFLFPE